MNRATSIWDFTPSTGKRERVYKTVSGSKDDANYILGQILADFADTDNALVVL